MRAPRLVLPATREAEPTLDADQLAALDALAAGKNVAVVGGPGTGKTTLAVAAAVRAIHGGVDPRKVMVLAPTRTAAAALRERVSLAVGVPTSTPVARTASSLAFAILARAASDLDEPAPALISGAEQDVVLKDLLLGHAVGRVAPLDWGPDIPQEATALPGFRDELRDVLMRAAEAGLAPDQLASLADAASRPAWRAAAALYDEYEAVMALRTTPTDQGARYDPATIVSRAAQVLHDWDSEVGSDCPSWELVIVDDHQDSTRATSSLIDACVARGARVMVIGNADESVQGYRGAVPSGIGADASRYSCATVELERCYRQHGALAALSAAVASRIGVKGGSSARAWIRGAEPVAGQGEPPVVVLVSPHRTAQSRAIAAELRAAHRGIGPQGQAGEPVQWSRMAVVARSGSLLRALRSDLIAADIPCESLSDATALHLEPAVAPLLQVVRLALGAPWSQELAMELLQSRVVGLDAVALRRLRRALAAHERALGGERPSAELLVEALESPGALAAVAGPEAAAAARLVEAVRCAKVAAGRAGATPGEVIWAAWNALGVAQSWRTAALAGSTRDDADLDAVISLMRAAQTFTERLPEASVTAFADYLQGQNFSADSLGVRAAAGEVVSFATPASAAGKQFDVVVIAGLEEGVWPNLTLRDSVLGAQRLADALAEGLPGAAERASSAADLRAARAAVLDDETRALLVAVSRARRSVVVTAVSDADSRPSRFMILIEQASGVERVSSHTRASVADLRTAVARLRALGEADAQAVRDASDGDKGGRDHAAMLASLARLGIPGAHPLEWHGAATQSTHEPLWLDDERVRVSPSKVEAVETCTLRWALEATGGTKPSSDAQEVGTLLHTIAQEHPHGGKEAILADFDAAWAQRYRTETWAERVAYDNARLKATRLANYLDSRGDVPVLTEQEFAVEIEGALLAGSADRIEVRDGGAYVVDLKTGQAIPSKVEAADHAQLAMYQLAIAEGGVDGLREPRGAELIFVSAGTAGTVRSQEPIDHDAAKDRLAAVVAQMRSAVFTARVSQRCEGCPVRQACPAHAQGRQVSQS